MKKIAFLLLFLLILNCNNERVLQLPETEHSDITELLDMSPAYIFYDETQQDSTLFNRKNLIGTTNWAVNVDKRLTLRQAIPHIQYLQNKRQKASMHKNEDAKNYFTCNDISIGNLGFLEFTEVNYFNISKRNEVLEHCIKKEPTLLVEFNNVEEFKIYDLFAGRINELDNTDYKTIESLGNIEYYGKVILSFNPELDFQSYISIKSQISRIESNSIRIHYKEFIY